jgi:hypothetical protein
MYFILDTKISEESVFKQVYSSTQQSLTSLLIYQTLFLVVLIICMMFTYLKFRMFVSSTGQSGKVKYYHLVSVVIKHI